MKRKAKAKPRKTMRIYYGTGKVKLYWTVRVHDAKKDVEMEGTLWDAINGTPGETIGCQLSNCTLNNATKFPHPCILPSFTKDVCAIIDRVVDGAPSHAVRYVHGYGDIVELNDTDKTKQKIRQNPGLAERTFVLRAPRGNKKKGAVRRTNTTTGNNSGVKSPLVPRGALARARKANLVTADLERVLRTG